MLARAGPGMHPARLGSARSGGGVPFRDAIGGSRGGSRPRGPRRPDAPGRPVLLAVSGGADSLCLMVAAFERAGRHGWSLGVGHVHHGWRAREADRDLAFVRDHARRRGLPFLFRRVDARTASRRLQVSPEAGARSVRYAALAEMAREFGAARIATAHQQDDRVESYLLALRRRGGVASMAGPRRRRDDGVVRPLLSVRRVQIADSSPNGISPGAGTRPTETSPSRETPSGARSRGPRHGNARDGRRRPSIGPRCATGSTATSRRTSLRPFAGGRDPS